MSENFIEVQQRIIIEIIQQVLTVQLISQKSLKLLNNSKLSSLIKLDKFNNNDTLR